MNKNQGILTGIAFILLFTGIAIVTASTSLDVIIYAFDQNPAGSDEGNEWVTIHNPSNESVDIDNWTLDLFRKNVPPTFSENLLGAFPL